QLPLVSISKACGRMQKIITAEIGQDVTLTCRAPKNNKIMIVEWSRVDLDKKYVLVYRDSQFIPDHQHPSFKNRVDLKDRQMKDGDVSLTLKKVTTADEGTYECHVLMEETNSWEHSSIVRQLVTFTSFDEVDSKNHIVCLHRLKMTISCITVILS
uniref:Ig-like domain-containing protein n=1 Tax=Amphilophus citrinellus TaxID=61819 RepID=A0A3Q0RIT4_AMPCI